MTYSDFDLMQMQTDALFVHDASGRLVRINEPEPEPIQPAPRFFLGRTRMGNLCRVRYDLQDALAAELEWLVADEPVDRALDETPAHEAEYIKLVGQDAPVVTWSGPAYALPELAPPRNAATITPENVALVQAHFPWLLTTLAAYAPVTAVVVDEKAVAVCFCSRITPLACEAGVYTEENSRGHGYATNAVRGWATGVRAAGRVPLYSTSWSNHASQAIARKLGAVQYGVDFSLT